MILEHQKAVIAALRANATLMAIVDSVSDRRNPGAGTYPYVTVETMASEWGTDTGDGFQVSTRVHSWSNSGSNKQTGDIQQAVYDTLHRAALTVTGFTVVLVQFSDSQILDDPDGVTIHGVTEFVTLMQKAT